MKKRLFAMVMMLILCMSLTAVPAFATEGDTTEPDSNAAVGGGIAQTDPVLTDTPSDTTGTTGAETSTSTEGGGYYGDIPTSEDVLGIAGADVVTTDDVNNWIDRKGGELISIVEKVVRWISVIAFFVSLGFVIVGAVGDKRKMVGGFIGMVVCCVVFAVATCGPQVMQIVASWLRS